MTAFILVLFSRSVAYAQVRSIYLVGILCAVIIFIRVIRLIPYL
jgi:hypothetical protein